MSERHGGSVESPTTTPARTEESAEGSDALTALRSIWGANQQSGTVLDEERPKKVCPRMKGIGFGGISGEEDEGSTDVPVGDDMRSAWRDLLQREGKFYPGGAPVRTDAANRH